MPRPYVFVLICWAQAYQSCGKIYRANSGDIRHRIARSGNIRMLAQGKIKALVKAFGH
jgi:hypothetical protein